MCTALVAADAVDGAVQRFNAPAGGLVHVDVESRLIELDHVDAVGGEPAGLFVEQRCKRHRHCHAIAVVSVGDGIDDGHRAGQGEFQLSPGVGAGEPRFARVDARRSRSGPVTVGHIAL